MAAVPVPDQQIDERGVTGAALPHYEPVDPIPPAFRQSNLIVSTLQRLRNTGEFAPDPDHNPMSIIKGTPYEGANLDRFAASASEPETRSIMRQIDQEESDRRALQAAGGAGIVAGMVAGTFDPTILLPGSIAIKAGRAGAGLLRAGVEVGLAGAIQSGVQEAGLRATQETRTTSESLLNVGSATVLSAIIGGPAARLLGPAEHAAVVAHLDREQSEMNAHAGNTVTLRPAERPVSTDGVLDLGRGPDVDSFDILDPSGAKVSTLDVQADGDKLAINWIGPEGGRKATNELGPAKIRAIIDQLAERYPEAKTLTGQRVSGARTDIGEGFEISMPLRRRPNMLASLMAEREVEAQQRGGMQRPIAEAAAAAAQMELNLHGPAGAAIADTRRLDVVPTGVKLENLGFDPMSRLVTSPSVAARRAAVDLAETPLRFKENIEGIPTTSGPALDRIARMQIAQTRVAVGDELIKQWKELRFGGEAEAPRFARFRDTVGQMTGDRPSGLTFDQFKQEVSLALTKGDQHEIPQVQAAAQFVRARVFDPWKERAIAAGLLSEETGVKTADSYLQRVYNKTAIAARRPEFVNTVMDWLKADQEQKATAQTRIGAFSGALASHESNVKKLTGQLQRKSDALELDEALRDEVSRINKFAFQRSTTLRESEFRNDGGVRVAVPGKNIEKARGGAVFESKVRERGNDLADRASAHAAEVQQLEERLMAEHASAGEMRRRIEDEIGRWEGKSTGEAKAAIKAREKYEAERAAKANPDKPKGGRTTSADDAVDRAVKRIMESDRSLSDGELRDRAHQITERILGSPAGRLPYDEATGGPQVGYHAESAEPPRGPLAGRVFNIPDDLLRPYLEHDIEHIVQTHLRTMVPDVLLTERFGDVGMSEAFRKVEDEFAALIDRTKTERDRTKLAKAREAALRDLAGVRDRVRGVYGLDVWNTMRGAARTAAAVKNFNVVASMGMATITSIPDMAGSIFRYGLGSTFRDSWTPFLRYMMRQDDTWAKAAAQFRAMGIATESVMASRGHALSDIMDSYRPQSRVERTLQWGADKFQFANLLAPWTDFGKVNASMIAGSEILRASEALAGGTATKKQIAALAESGIDSHMADRIARAFADGGSTEKGVRLPNTADWKDLSARQAFEGAVSREADIAIITPGQEKPLWLSNPVISVLGQFKSFTAAATQRILIANLQRRDAQVMQGVLFSMGLGMTSYKINALLGGQPTSENPADWVKESISRGNLFGWLEEGNALAAKMSRGGVDVYRLIGAQKPLSRYAGRSVLDQMLGPTAGKIEALAQVTGASAARDWNQGDTKALRKLIATQNLFYLRGLFNQVEAGANNAFGIPMKEPAAKH